MKKTHHITREKESSPKIGEQTPMFNPEILADNIKNCRCKLGLTQTELAKRLYVSAQAVSKWESGQAIPDLGNLTQLADLFATSVDKLIAHASIAAERAFLGIDGGTTKTEFVLVNEDGLVIHRLLLEGSNPKISGLEKTLSVLKRGIDRMLLIRDDIQGIFAGITGVKYGNRIQKIKDFLGKAYPLINASVDTDSSIAFSSIPNLDSFAAMICGTGFAIHARMGKEYHRVAAWGYVLDNMCGGYGIGREVIRAALAEQDGFGDKTAMTPAVCERLGNRILDDGHDEIYSAGAGFIAEFAPIAFDAYEAGDAVAAKILNDSAEEMSNVLSYALATYGCSSTVVLTGGLAKNNALVDLIRNKIPADVTFISAPLPPIYGACLNACTLYGKVSDNFFDIFKKTYASL